MLNHKTQVDVCWWVQNCGVFSGPRYRVLSPAGRPEWLGHNSNWTQRSWSGPLQVWLWFWDGGQSTPALTPDFPAHRMDWSILNLQGICMWKFSKVWIFCSKAEAVEHPISTHLSLPLPAPLAKYGQASPPLGLPLWEAALIVPVTWFHLSGKAASGGWHTSFGFD